MQNKTKNRNIGTGTKIATAALGAFVLFSPHMVQRNKLKSIEKVVVVSDIPACAEGSYKFEQFKKNLHNNIELCFRDGTWDAKALMQLQKTYFQLQSNACKPDFVVEGIPKSVIDMMPLIAQVAEEHGVDKNVAAAIVAGESSGYPYALHVNGKEESLGLMQVNIRAHTLTESEYRDILDPRTNINLALRYWKKCNEKARGNIDVALMFYNRGINSKAVNKRRAMRDSYVRGVKRMMSLLRDYEPQTITVPLRDEPR